jgi:hypothetical protein
MVKNVKSRCIGRTPLMQRLRNRATTLLSWAQTLTLTQQKSLHRRAALAITSLQPGRRGFRPRKEFKKNSFFS